MNARNARERTKQSDWNLRQRDWHKQRGSFIIFIFFLASWDRVHIKAFYKLILLSICFKYTT